MYFMLSEIVSILLKKTCMLYMLLGVFCKYVEPNRHFVLQINSLGCDCFIGPQL
jgi:hypothetical protein